jgi:hypothetical protein
MITLPAGNGPRGLGSIIDEPDALIFGEDLFHRLGGESTREHEGLVPASDVGDLGTHMEIDGDHLLIMKQSVLVQNAIRSWRIDHTDP